jgi:hypothetical protein
LLTFMQHNTLCTPCISFTVKQGHEEPPEPAPIEYTNLEQDQDKLQCI